MIDPRPCRTCGAPVPPIEGMGRPRLYCEAHAPSRRLYLARWQRDHADHIREYQRHRSGHRPRMDRTCPCPCRLGLPCAEHFRGYLATCPRCRRPEHAARWQS